MAGEVRLKPFWTLQKDQLAFVPMNPLAITEGGGKRLHAHRHRYRVLIPVIH